MSKIKARFSVLGGILLLAVSGQLLSEEPSAKPEFSVSAGPTSAGEIQGSDGTDGVTVKQAADFSQQNSDLSKKQLSKAEPESNESPINTSLGPPAGSKEAIDAIKAEVKKLAEELNLVVGQPQADLEDASRISWWADFLLETTKSKKILMALLDESEGAVNEGSLLERTHWWNGVKNLSDGVKAELVHAESSKDPSVNKDGLQQANSKIELLTKQARKNIAAAADSLDRLHSDITGILAEVNTSLSRVYSSELGRN
jgi:hypothetical protein